MKAIARTASRGCVVTRSTAKNRHPDYVQKVNKGILVDRPDVEGYAHYNRTDFAEELAAQARQALAANIARGEAGMRLAEAALQVAAEDDAVASSSTVAFPVAAFLARLERLAESIARHPALQQLQEQQQQEERQQQQEQHDEGGAGSSGSSTITTECSGGGSGSSGGSGSNKGCGVMHRPELLARAVAAVEAQLFGQQGLRAPGWGRSNLPRNTLIDHPGVWEDARAAYLNEVLVRRQGHPAVLAIAAAHVCQRLLAMGALPCAVAVDCGSFDRPPRLAALPNMTRDRVMLNLPGQAEVTPLNTCSSEALIELLIHLKRSYWPFAWDTNVDDPAVGGTGSLGGFRGAAKAALGQEVSANLRAIAASASHRLERGIWTSPGAGDLRRALAAAERLVMLVGDVRPEERRDLAVLYLHAGRLPEAAAELDAYAAATAPGARRLGRQSAPTSPFDARLVQQLQQLLASMPGTVMPARHVMSVDKVLRGQAPAAGGSGSSGSSGGRRGKRPLTW